MSSRKLKIYGKPIFINGKFGKRNFKGFSPQIILQGNWLKKAGFEHQEEIKINIVNNKIIIEKL